MMSDGRVREEREYAQDMRRMSHSQQGIYIGPDFNTVCGPKRVKSNLPNGFPKIPCPLPNRNHKCEIVGVAHYSTAPASLMYPIRSFIVKKEYSRLLIVDTSSPRFDGEAAQFEHD